MNQREYLRSKGFTVGERGRFSAEMKAALASAPEGAIVEAVVKTPSTPRVSVTKTPKVETVKSNADPKAVRAWAVENNVPVGVRGRIKPEVFAAYEAAKTGSGEEVQVRKPEGNGTGEPAPQIHGDEIQWGYIDPKGKTWTTNNKTACANSGYSISHCAENVHRGLVGGVGLDLVQIQRV